MIRTASLVYGNGYYGSYSDSEPRIQQLNSCQQTFESEERLRRKKAIIVLVMIVILQNVTEYGFAVNITKISSKINITIHGNLFACNHKNASHIQGPGAPLNAYYGIVATIYYLLLAFFSAFGGYLGDGRTGRLKAIKFSLVMLIAGSAAFIVLECLLLHTTHHIVLIIFVLCVALFAAGSGIHCSNIIPFGAEQVMNISSDSTYLLAVYVAHGYYFFRNVGCAIAFSGVSYLQERDMNESLSIIGHSIPLVTSSISLLIIIMSHAVFAQQLPQHNMTKMFFRIVREGFHLSRVPNLIPVSRLGVLDYSRSIYGGSFSDLEVNAVQTILQMVPKLSLFIIYFALYSQMHTTFFIQGTYISSPNNVKYVSVEVVNNAVIITLIPIFVYVYQKHEQRISSFYTKLQIGFALISLSMVVAGILEFYRKKGYVSNSTATIHYYCRFPQYILLGVSEVFAVVAGIQMAIVNAPRIFRSIAFGIYFMFSALGIFVSGIVFLITKVVTDTFHHGDRWICNNLNDGQLYYFYDLLSVLMLFNMFIVIGYSRSSMLSTNNRTRQ